MHVWINQMYNHNPYSKDAPLCMYRHLLISLYFAQLENENGDTERRNTVEFSLRPTPNTNTHASTGNFDHDTSSGMDSSASCGLTRIPQTALNTTLSPTCTTRSDLRPEIRFQRRRLSRNCMRSEQRLALENAEVMLKCRSIVHRHAQQRS
jgi:hypothetical protein